MIAIDTNILVYAHRADSLHHSAADPPLRALAQSKANWAIPSQCISEFVSVVTNPKIYARPSTLAEAFAQIEAWQGASGFHWITNTPAHVSVYANVCIAAKISGAMAHDARIAAICIENGVSELWTADRDFSRFRGLKVVNPLVNDMPK
jgi:uncharacterized protein